MDNKILLESIKKNIEEMKRFRPTLRNQVEEVLNSIATEIIEVGAQYFIKIKNRDFYIGEYYENCMGRELSTGKEFVEIDGGSCEADYIKGFSGFSYNFSNADINFLAQNIEEILEQINSKLDSSNKYLKPLIKKTDKILSVLNESDDEEALAKDIAEIATEEYAKEHTMVCPKCGGTAYNEAPNGAGILEPCSFYCESCGWVEE